ncbi:MAG: pilus assembly protein [Pelagimonas sp.]|jgi:Flp pilus assembly pilin Flp|nr:pilus assembly protein [Pelagimonas sp.]
MMSCLNRLVRRFRKEQDGTATIEFVLYFSLFSTILATGIEIGYMNLRHSMLDRAVDLVTREIQLATGTQYDYNKARRRICEEADILKNCENNLRLEMVQVDPRQFQSLPQQADCQNAVETPRPVRDFEHGQDNELMLIRACLKYQPVLPTTGLGKAMNKDTQGFAQMIVTSAFVQEPR